MKEMAMGEPRDWLEAFAASSLSLNTRT